MEHTFRDHPLPGDLQSVRTIVRATGFFSDEEVDVAVELVDAGLTGDSLGSYLFCFCEDDSGRVLGYTCYGPVICTVGSFDLYWIAVHPDFQGTGIGGELLKRTEDRIRSLAGRRIYIETASRDLYKPTQGFYSKAGYHAEATLKDYYAEGDSKIIYVKHL